MSWYYELLIGLVQLFVFASNDVKNFDYLSGLSVDELTRIQKKENTFRNICKIISAILVISAIINNRIFSYILVLSSIFFTVVAHMGSAINNAIKYKIETLANYNSLLENAKLEDSKFNRIIKCPICDGGKYCVELEKVNYWSDARPETEYDIAMGGTIEALENRYSQYEDRILGSTEPGDSTREYRITNCIFCKGTGEVYGKFESGKVTFKGLDENECKHYEKLKTPIVYEANGVWEFEKSRSRQV